MANYPNNKEGFTHAEEAVLTTLLYSDIFYFPLTRDELWQYLIASQPIQVEVFEKARKSLLAKAIISENDGYFCIKGQELSIAKRISDLPEVAKKKKLAQKIAARLAAIPTVQCIGISGGLAAGKGEAKDDIDFFIIAKKNAVFVTRLWILFILEFLGVRRSRQMRDATDKICVNLLIDETALTWAKEKHDVYIAREIAQIQPLFERETMYTRFINANTWVTNFMPNAFARQRITQSITVQKSMKFFLSSTTFLLVEQLLRVLQTAYMNRHRTSEIVTKHHLALHPNDYRVKTLAQLRLKMRQLGLLTKM